MTRFNTATTVTMAELITPIMTQLFTGLFTLAVCCLTFAVGYLHYVHTKWAHVPGPPRDSFFSGHLPSLKRWRRDKKGIFAELLEKWADEYGTTYVIIIFHKVLVCTLDAEALKELYITNGGHSKPQDWEFVGFLFGERFIGRGLVTEPNTEKWSKRRSIMNPVFHRKFLRSIISEFNNVGDKLIAKLAAVADGKTVIDLEQELHHTTLDVIGKIAFDKDLDSLHDAASPFPKAIYKSLHGFAVQVQDPLHKLKIWDKRQFKEEVRTACRVIRAAGRDWLTERRTAIERGDDVPADILTLIISAQDAHPDSMDMETVLDDIATFFIAGQETTANSVSFSLLEIARNPEIQDKIVTEISEVIGSREEIKFDDVGRLEYTSNVMKESLRLYPPASIAFKEVDRDITIEGYKIYVGTKIVVSSFINGRSDLFHQDPLKFDPERFNPTCSYRPSMYTYFPFGLGARNCIGQNFAQIEGKLLLVKILHHFHVQLDPSYVFGIDEKLTIRPVNGLKCTLTLRK